MINIKVNVKSAGSKKNKITAIIIPYDDNVNDVKGLLEETVKYCVESYNERRENSELLQALTLSQIKDKASEGKVSFGMNYGEKNADLGKSVADAVEAFEDGVVVLFADDNKLEDLDDKIDLSATESLTFIKLTMLAGRMW